MTGLESRPVPNSGRTSFDSIHEEDVMVEVNVDMETTNNTTARPRRMSDSNLSEGRISEGRNSEARISASRLSEPRSSDGYKHEPVIPAHLRNNPLLNCNGNGNHFHHPNGDHYPNGFPPRMITRAGNGNGPHHVKYMPDGHVKYTGMYNMESRSAAVDHKVRSWQRTSDNDLSEFVNSIKDYGIEGQQMGKHVSYGASLDRKPSMDSVISGAALDYAVPPTAPSETGMSIHRGGASVAGSRAVSSRGGSYKTKGSQRQAQVLKHRTTRFQLHADLDESEEESAEEDGDDKNEKEEDDGSDIGSADGSGGEGVTSLLVFYEDQPSAQESLPFHWDENTLKGYAREHPSFDSKKSKKNKKKKKPQKKKDSRPIKQRMKDYGMSKAEKWAPITGTALAVAGATYILREASFPLGELRGKWIKEMLDKDIFLSMLVMGLTSMALVMFAAATVSLFAPRAAGSGIPETKAFLNGCQLRGLFNIRTLVVKLIGLVLMLPSGVPVGREGPMVHIGASAAATIAFHFSNIDAFKFWHGYGFQWERRDLITCGVAAGIAAAFLSPIGGVLFALEDVASYWSVKVTWKTFICAALAILFRNVLYNTGNAFTSHSLTDGGDEEWGTTDLPFFALLGCMSGVMMGLYTHITTWLIQWEKSQKWLKGSWWPKVLFAGAVTFLVAMVEFALPFTVQCKATGGMDEHAEDILDVHRALQAQINGDDEVSFGHESESSHHGDGHDSHTLDYIRYTCDEDEYNPIATLMLPTAIGESELVLKQLLSRQTSEDLLDFDLGVLALFSVVWYILTLSVITMPVPYDLFDPHMIFGAAFGRLFGKVIENMWSGTAHPGIYALMGMGATLGSFTRMTIAITVIIVEMTGDTKMLLPIMLTIFSGKIAADFVSPETFTTNIGIIKRYRILEEYPCSEIVRLRAKDAMTTHVHTVEAVDTLGHLAFLVGNTRHNGFPVVVSSDQDGNLLLPPVFKSFIKRRKLFSIMKNELKKLLKDLPELVTESKLRIPVEYIDHPVDVLSKVSGTQLYTNLGMVVQPDLPMYRVYRFFSQLGMRHVCVVDDNHKLHGIITRDNLLLLNATEAAEAMNLDLEEGGPGPGEETKEEGEQDGKKDEGAKEHDGVLSPVPSVDEIAEMTADEAHEDVKESEKQAPDPKYHPLPKISSGSEESDSKESSPKPASKDQEPMKSIIRRFSWGKPNTKPATKESEPLVHPGSVTPPLMSSPLSTGTPGDANGIENKQE